MFASFALRASWSSRWAVSCECSSFPFLDIPSLTVALNGLAWASVEPIVTSSEQPANHEPKCGRAEPGSQRVKANEAGPLRTDLEGANRRHANASATARAFCLGTIIAAWRALLVRRPILALVWASATTSAEAVRDLCDRNHDPIALLNGLAIHVANIQTAGQDVADGAERSWARHGAVEIIRNA